MNTEPPHEIRHVPANTRPPFGFVMLTPDEERELAGKGPEDRAAWVASMPVAEFLGRILESQELPWLAQRARKGDFRGRAGAQLLLKLLKEAARYDLVRSIREWIR